MPILTGRAFRTSHLLSLKREKSRFFGWTGEVLSVPLPDPARLFLPRGSGDPKSRFIFSMKLFNLKGLNISKFINSESQLPAV